MSHAPQRSSTGRRVGRRLLLLLALAACRHDGGDKAPNASDASGEPRQTVADKGRGGEAACEPSPAVDPRLLDSTTAWADFERQLHSVDVRFVNTQDDSTITRVALCDSGCDSVTLQIVSERRTDCNTVGNFDSTRIVGLWRVLEGTVTPPGWGRTFNKGDSIFLFARDTFSSASVVYQVGDRVHRAPPHAWNFRYCQEAHVGTGPQGRWRTRELTLQRQRRDTLPGGGDPPGTYGWMSCASGCCQFYIPPTNEGNGSGDGKPPCPES